MITISFLGTGKYEETTYTYNNKQCITRFFPVAVNSFFKDKIEKSFIVMTEEAGGKHGVALSKEISFDKISIPNGETDEQIWQIFEKITERVPENKEIVFDITHGFRAQPLIAMACLMYLRAQKKIIIKNILYGAYEARDKEKNISPVFDLKPFVDIIDWSNAINEFIQNGNLKAFKTLLSQAASDKAGGFLPDQQVLFEEAGNDLMNLTNSFLTFRLKEITKDYFNFALKKSQLQNISENNPRIRPFGLVVNKIFKEFSFLNVDPDELFQEKGVKAQKEMIKWYLKTEQYQKAITLTREYIITKAILLSGNQGKITNYEFRKEIGELLIKWDKEKLKKVPDYFFKIWEKVTNIRNDINHAGIPKLNSPKTAKEHVELINKICSEVIEKL